MTNLLHIISSLKIGGAEIVLYDLIERLENQGFKNSVIYFHNGPVADRLQNLGIQVYQCQGSLSTYDPFFLMNLIRLVKKIKPDLIHTSLWAANFYGRIIGKLLKIPTLSAIHLGPDQDGRVRNLIDAITFFLSGCTVAVSDTVAQSMKTYWWARAIKITIIKNGVNSHNLKQLSLSSARDRFDLGFADQDFVIGSVGRFIPRKNYHFLLETFALLVKQHNAARLVLVGFGPLEQSLREYAQRLQIADHVSFVVGKPASGYYQFFDCFVLPSLQEGLSIALLEAMACGLPCIITHSSKHHDVIDHGINGFVAAHHDREQLLGYLLQLCKNDKIKHSLGEQAYKTICKDYDSARMVEQYTALYATMRAFK